VDTSQTTEPVPRAVVEGFYADLAKCDMDALAPYLDDNVVWTISGPVDLLPFCGVHRGKANVLDMIGGQVPQVLQTFSFVPETFLVQGDRAAMLSRQSSRRTADGRTMSYRVANFMRFRASKLIDNLSLIDSFDAVEQALGHPLALPDGARRANDLIAL
jgi:ketosteroid isomerase-like protein